MDDARKKYQDVADHADANYASLAKLVAGADRCRPKIATPKPRNLLKDLMDHPTDLVSKDAGDYRIRQGDRGPPAG